MLFNQSKSPARERRFRAPAAILTSAFLGLTLAGCLSSPNILAADENHIVLTVHGGSEPVELSTEHCASFGRDVQLDKVETMSDNYAVAWYNCVPR